MSNRRLPILFWTACGIAAAALLVVPSVGADPNPEAARLALYAQPDGTALFALGLKAPGGLPVAQRHDVVVLVNTSAAQTGQYRTDGLAALDALLKGLGPQDRVALMAVDMDAAPMTAGLVAADGPEMAEALKKLNGRAPLGTTDLEKGLVAAAGALSGSTAPRSVVYIGEGTSKLNLLLPEAYERLIGSLADNRIAVSSLAIGPSPDKQLLGSLAANTGGVVLEADKVAAQEAGKRLAVAADGAVLWPTRATWPAAFTAVLPKRVPPLRADRESIVIGTGTLKAGAPLDVQIAVAGPSGDRVLSWKVTPPASSDENGYLQKLVVAAKPSGGLALPLAGWHFLKELQQEITMGSQGLTELARQALSAGDAAGAEKLAREAIAQNPQDDTAIAVLAAAMARSAPGKNGKAAAGGPDLNLVGKAPEAAEPAPEGSLLNQIEIQRKLAAQELNAAVTVALNQARKNMSREPDLVTQDLKLQLEAVKQAKDLDPQVRDQLKNQIEIVLRETERSREAFETRRQRDLALLARAADERMIADNLTRDQQKLSALMEHFTAMMAEGRYRIAEDQVAVEAEKLTAGDPVPNPVPTQAIQKARMEGALVEMLALRIERQKKTWDTLAMAERAHIPFPDEPPIVYPDADTWRILSERRIREYRSMDLAKRGSAEQAILDALNSPVEEFTFEQAPFTEVIDHINKVHKINVVLDTKALEDMSVDVSATQITQTLKGISLRSALKITLAQVSLTYIIKDEVLQITTPDRAENTLVTKVYPVADLVLPIQSMGGMGGMMGGMGGMMGGMGGGMGGMGGGMFNLPPNGQNVLPRPGVQNGFRAMCVEDDLNLTPQTVSASVPAVTRSAAESLAKTQPASGRPPRKIDLSIPKGDDAESVWERHFAAHKESPADVRETVRSLWKAKDYEQVIALIQAALRQNHAQPAWMYEALGMAMQAAKRPSDQVERAVMSAVEFADSTLDLMNIGRYLEQIGLQKRALQVYRQVAQLEPLRPEPFVHGLRVAQKLNDLEGIQWTTAGILSQAWTGEQMHVWEQGARVAKATLDRLEAENRVDEAKRFRAALDAAVARDCMLRVTWTGDADVDVAVQEPAGTFCSMRSPRTSSGGVLLGDLPKQVGKLATGANSEIYVCPKGFSGTYKVFVRKVWGQVTANQVKVEVCTHFLTPQESRLAKPVKLQRDQAVVEFELKDGRRLESLQERQVANAAMPHLALRQQILAQQLAGAVDPAAESSYYGSQQNYWGGGRNANPFIPFVGRGAVGYQPVIQTLPEGASMSATAVISADRRYVRITTTPLFSGIGEVNTFNTSTGAGGTTGGGTGGQGFSSQFNNSGSGSNTGGFF